MAEKKTIRVLVTIGGVILVLALLAWFVNMMFEGEKPQVHVDPLPEYLSGAQAFKVTIRDTKRGLKALKVTVAQGNRNVDILNQPFPFKGLFNSGGVRLYETECIVDPFSLNLSQGRVDLLVRVWDYSRRGGGDGNQTLFQHKLILDTIPPAIRALSRMNYANLGGAGLVVYQTSSDAVESGVFVRDLFFKGFPVTEGAEDGRCVSYFAIPCDADMRTPVLLWAKDKAGNISKAEFPLHLRRKRFRKERINITDRFLDRMLPYFSFYAPAREGAPIDRFLKINGGLRKENAETFFALRTDTVPTRLWEGGWVRLKNAANMAQFADHREYFYKGQRIDEKVHMGVDLASLVHSEIQAANHGRVIYRDRLGIYGNTVVLDHGQGVASVYAHLSSFTVEPGQEVRKGDVVGYTGQTGLAGGDHLHFGIMVGGVFVNPIEWWDPHWIQDNITRKLALLK